MADSDKNILITPNTGSTTDSPKIEFTGGDNNTVTLTTLDDGTLSFSGTSGQLFSISDSLTGTIFSVNDVSGIPSIEVDDDGTVRLAEFGGNLLIGTDVASQYDYKVQVDGNIEVRGDSSPYIRFTEGTTEKAYIQWSSLGFLQLGNDEDGSRLRLKDDLEFTQNGSTWHSVFHEGYHPNADKLTTARTINGVSFDGTSNITVADNTKLPLSGGTVSGVTTFNNHVYINPNGTALNFNSDGSRDTIIWQRNGTRKWSINHTDSNTLNFTPADTATNNVQINGNRILTVADEGSGNGLDADLLDGQHASAFASASHSHSNYLTTTGKAADSNLLDGIDSSWFVYGSGPNKTMGGDPSTLRPSGFYENYQGNSPTNTWYSYINMRHTSTGNGHGHQIAGSFYSNGDLYNRHYDGNGSFDGWSKIWNTSNDGSGSGLDADTVDGIHAGSFLRSDADDTASGSISFTKTSNHAIQVGTVRGRTVGSQSGEYIHLYDRVHIGSPSGWGSRGAPQYGLSTYGGAEFCQDTGSVKIGDNISQTHGGLQILRNGGIPNSSGYSVANGASIELYSNNNPVLGFHNSGTSACSLYESSGDLYLTRWNGSATGSRLWHSNNDGSGSGLDADLLDGQHASAFASSGHSHTLTLSGDVSGSGSVSGTISVTVNNDSHSHSNYTPLDHFRHTGHGNYTSTTTSALISEALGDDAFDSKLTAHKTGWSYAGNGDLTDAGRLKELAGTSWLWWTDNSTDNVQGNITGLCIAPNTGGSAGKMFVYNNQGSSYAPGWREIWTSTSDGSGSGLDADTVDGKHASEFANASHSHTLTLNGDVSGSGSVSGTITVTVNDNSHNHTSVPSISSTSPGSSYDNSLQYWQTSGQGTAYAPTTDWYNTIRGAHGNANTYYSNTLAMKMTGSYVGDIYTQTRSNGTLQGWNRFWHSNNDGSGSGLDADLLDGNHASAFVLKTGGTISGTLTLQTTNDAQLYLNGNGSTWAGIAWTDVNSTDYMWYRGATGTFAIGGSGSSVSGKKLHIDGGTTIGATLDGTIAPSNGLKVEGEIHDNQGGVFSSYTHSGSDFVNGTLVQTNIPATSTNGASYVLEVTGKSYSSSPPFSFIAQGYLYNNTIISHSGVNLSGHGPSYIKAMEYNGNLCFWWPRISYWNSFEVRVRDAGGSSVNRVTSIGNATEPSATKKVQTNLVKTWNSGNDGSGSGLDADLLDGYEWMSSGKSVRASEFYADNWFRNYNSGEGLYNEANAMHWYSEGNTSYSIYSGQSTTSIRFKTSGNATRGYVYANNSNQIGFLNSSGGWSLKVDNSGNTVATGNVTAYSDERLKSDIKPIQNALKTVTSLNGVTYIRKDTGKKELGFIAQNVKKIVPELVDVIDTSTSEEEGYNDLHVMKYQNTVALLVEAIKEQQTQINELQAQLNILKGE